MQFPFELLDIYLGAWAASCLPGMDEKRLLPSVPDNVELPGYEDELTRRRSFLAPDGAKHLKKRPLSRPVSAGRCRQSRLQPRHHEAVPLH